MNKLKIPQAESALLVIDMQNGFVCENSGMGKSPSGTKKQRAIVPAIKHIAAIFHARGMPVIWSRQEHFSGDKMRARRTIVPHSVKQGFLPCVRGTDETGFYASLTDSILEQDHFVDKHRASVFYNTNLETKLRMLGTRFLFIAGCNTEFCVESTVRDAYARDFEIIVVRDCVAGIREDFHKNSLKVIESYFGEVLPLETLENVFV